MEISDKPPTRAWLALLCLYAFAMSAYFALTNPPFEAPDEGSHLGYINFVATKGELPDQLDPRKRVDGEGHQHPLYYILAGMVYRFGTDQDGVGAAIQDNPESVLAGGSAEHVPRVAGVAWKDETDRRSFYFLRLLNSVFVALTVLVVGLAARMVFPAGTALWPPLLVATLPQLQFIGGSIGNDALTALLAAIVVYFAVKAIQMPITRRWVALGVWIGVAALVKKSNLVFVPLGAGLPFLVSALGRGIDARQMRSLPAAGLVALTAMLFVGPLVARNVLLYGDPLGSGMEEATLAALHDPRPLWSTYFLRGFPLGVARSFYAEFGWMNVHVPTFLTLVFYAILFAPILIVRQRARELGLQRIALFCGTAVMVVICALVAYNLSFTQPQGRLLFPGLAALAILWGIGMGRFAAHRAVVVGVPAVLVAMNVWCAAVNWSFYH